jgi:hypothetical protein
MKAAYQRYLRFTRKHHRTAGRHNASKINTDGLAIIKQDVSHGVATPEIGVREPNVASNAPQQTDCEQRQTKHHCNYQNDGDDEHDDVLAVIAPNSWPERFVYSHSK